MIDSDRVNYLVVVTASIAQHQSQGCLQLSLSGQPLSTFEYFWYFDLNGSANYAKAQALFQQMASVPYRAFHDCY